MFYWVIKALAWPFKRFYFRMVVHGLANLPERGPAIVVANHTSYLDAGVLGSALPRKVHFVVLSEMYRMWRIRWFYRGMETIAVNPGAGQHAPIRRCLKVLHAGSVMGIFPEGGRSHDGSLRTPQEGAALLALKSGAPVIPAAIRGAYESLPRGRKWPRPRRIDVLLGEPLFFPELPACDRLGRREALASFSREVMAAIASLLEREPFGADRKAGEIAR